MSSSRRVLSVLFCLGLVWSLACGGKGGDSRGEAEDPAKGERPERTERPKLAERRVFTLEGATIAHHGAADPKHSCDGAGVSPALSWDNAPAEAKSFVLIADDPDAEGRSFVQWLVYDIPADVRAIPELAPGSPLPAALAAAKQGQNGEERIGWAALCPPEGRSHRFLFRLYAMDAVLDLPAGATRKELEEKMAGHFLGQSAVVTNYTRAPAKAKS